MILVAKKCTVSGENGQFRLNRIDVEVGRGEMHAVIGPNGAGKSTLMGILSARHKPTENWKDPTSAGALSRFILWSPTRSLSTAIRDYKKRFKL